MLKANEHDSSIFNVKSPEFLINMKTVPPKNSVDRQSFIDEEVRKCIEGVNINGVFIPGSLYYDLNVHVIELDGDTGREYAHPKLRDNGWIIHNDYYKARQEKLHYCIGGSRQIGKSDILTSLTMREITIFDNTTAMLMFSSSEDKVVFSGKMKIAHDGLLEPKNNTDFLHVPLLDKDFNKSFIRFGFKETTNDDELHARLYLLNTAAGTNSEVGAGKTITFFAYDEIAKESFKEAWDAVQPAFRGRNGFRNSGFFAFTGGNVNKSKDAEKFFGNPDANSVLNIDGTGRFMDGTHRADFKKEMTYADYFRAQGFPVKPGTSFDKMKCDVTDYSIANYLLDDESAKLLKSGESNSYQKHKIYYPRKIGDMFMKEGANPYSDLFPELERLLETLRVSDVLQQTYELVDDGVEIKAVAVDKQYDPFSTDKDQPIVILEHPKEAQGKLYVMGHDPFNVNKTSQSPSVGSFYIMKKASTDYSDPWQDTMVCFYNGRKDIADCRKKLKLALQYYGADKGNITLLHEAADDTLTQWFMDNKIGHWLENTYNLAKQIFSNTKALSAKGLRPTVRNQDYGISKVMDYLTEELPDGRKGLWRIKDPLLVKQIIGYDGDLGVVDALVGFMHTVIHLYKEKNYVPKVQKAEEQEVIKVITESWSAFGAFKKKKATHTRSII